MYLLPSAPDFIKEVVDKIEENAENYEEAKLVAASILFNVVLNHNAKQDPLQSACEIAMQTIIDSGIAVLQKQPIIV
jgi:hypothetical protein